MLVLLWLVILPIITVFLFMVFSYTLYKIIQLEIFKTFTESEIDLARIISIYMHSPTKVQQRFNGRTLYNKCIPNKNIYPG